MNGNGAVVVFLIAVLVIGAVVFVVIVLSRRGGKLLDKAKYQQRWLKIESSLKSDNPESFQTTILQADKLLDMALKERGFKGQTMGERMKSANNQWKNSNHVWGAHKIRNRIAHEPDVHITYEIASRSLSAFKQALRDLGAL